MKRVDEDVKLLPREAEFTLGIIGGILGLFCSLLYIYFTFSLADEWVLKHFIPGLSRIIASVLVIWMAFKVQYEAKKAGAIFLVCGIWLLLLANVTKPAGIILIITGFMCLYRN
ncbi:hypothetical protein [Virgibacillus oceani]|uniref:Uncharacterized protein n=1 Tax=Virgibacillus oceani TaxID=1479511 RepID=A0A917M7K7_9BACI|nr:hypothetical protein [Virgibacillus oceani]GGG84246.1 hypothetical protein GCM10011398_32330 [Virgibacillus oceani]